MVSLTSMNSWRLSDLWTVQILITQNRPCPWKSILQCIQYTSFLSLPTVHSLTLTKQTSQEDDWGSREWRVTVSIGRGFFWQDVIANTSGFNGTDHWVKSQMALQRHSACMTVLVKCCLPRRGVINKNVTLFWQEVYQKVKWNGHFSYDEKMVQKDTSLMINIFPGGETDLQHSKPQGGLSCCFEQAMGD